MKKRVVGLLALCVGLLCAAGPVAATAETAKLRTPAGQNTEFPEIIPLPNGFAPEGVVVGHGTDIYAGSLVDGSIYRADLSTGEGEIAVSSPEGGVAVGLSFDRRSGLLFVAGGATGMAFVYDPETGETAATYELTTEESFVNDVIVTRRAAYFTDSFRPFIYRVPLGPAGALPDASEVEEIELGGEFVFVPGGFNANGIEAIQGGRALIIVNSTTGDLYRVNPRSGEARQIDLGGASLPNGDGILLVGRMLYVVQNQLNQIAVVRLAPNFLSGEITNVITDPDFRVPTTVTSFGQYLYAVNARFGVTPGPDVEYEIVQVPRR